MKQFLLKNNSKNLIVFFCGWGMDEKPFLVRESSQDVLFLYGYEDLGFEFDFSPYENITLLAFSYGVCVAGLVADKIPNVQKKIAINGTLIPIDDEYGVPVKMSLLTEKMDSKTIVKFRERLFFNKEHFEIFNNNLPQRTAESCTNELVKMKEFFKSEEVSDLKFDKVYIGLHDRVVPTKNQINFWQKYPPSDIIEIEDGHFPFYSYKTLEALWNKLC